MATILPLETLLARTAERHHHLCPRQVLGVRMGMLAADVLQLGLPQSDKRLFVFMETDGCTSDGVAVATGAWVGRRTMRMVDYGKVAATFVDTETGRAIRIFPSPQARQLAAQAAPEAPDRWHAQLIGYQRLPDSDLLVVNPVRLTVDLPAIIGQEGDRRTCWQCGEEVSNQRELEIDGRVWCRSCAGDRYFVASTSDHFRRGQSVVSTSEFEEATTCCSAAA